MMRALTSAWAQIASRPSRLVATIVAIAIGTGFVAAALVFTATFRADLAARVSVEYSHADLVVSPTTDSSVDELVDRVDSAPGVAEAEPLYYSNLEYTATGSHGYLTVQTAASERRLRWQHLVDGTWPSGAGQLAVTQSTATATNLAIGSTLTLTGAPGTNGRSAGQHKMTVAGIVTAPPSPLRSNQRVAFAPPDAFPALGVTSAPQIAVVGRPGIDAAAAQRAVSAALGNDATVLTVSEQAAEDLAVFTGQTTALTVILLVFAGIALLVAGIVIANTFTILLTARRRHIALLRCVGASTGQVRREVVVEAGLIGLGGSVLGVAAGVGVGIAAARVADLDSGGIAVSTVGVVVALVLGVALTMIAGSVPARRAMRVPPIAALRPVADTAEVRATGRLRLIAGSVFTIGGGLLLAAGVTAGSLLVAFPGGALSAIGVLLLLRSVLPPLLRSLGGIAGVTGVPGRLAAANAVRNPGRAAATSAALVVGVGLIVMLEVGAGSLGASMDKASADRYPVDVSVAGDGSALPRTVVSGVAATDGVNGVIDIPGVAATGALADGDPLPGLAVNAGPVGGGEGGAAPGGGTVTLLGLPPTANDVVRGDVSVLARHDDGLPTVIVPAWWVRSGAVQSGGVITLTVGAHTQRLVVAVNRLADAGVMGPTLITSADVLRRLAPHAPTVAVWAAVADDHDAAQVMSSLNTLLDGHPELMATGSVADRASLQSVLDTVTTVAIGLLAVAVVIAVVGIANTIGLSVIERTRESALLRALGLRRGQLRAMLALEALLLALVGAAVGVLLGLVYGWAGSTAMFREVGQPLVLAVPWGSVASVAGLALAAGVLASVLPARRAARVAPAASLAEE